MSLWKTKNGEKVFLVFPDKILFSGFSLSHFDTFPANCLLPNEISWLSVEKRRLLTVSKDYFSNCVRLAVVEKKKYLHPQLLLCCIEKFSQRSKSLKQKGKMFLQLVGVSALLPGLGKKWAGLRTRAIFSYLTFCIQLKKCSRICCKMRRQH